MVITDPQLQNDAETLTQTKQKRSRYTRKWTAIAHKRCFNTAACVKVKNRSTTNMKCSCRLVYCSKRRVKKKHETAKRAAAAKNRLSYSCRRFGQKTQQQQQQSYFLLIIKLACSCNQQKHFWKCKKRKTKAKLQKAENVKANYHCNGYILETDPLKDKSTSTAAKNKNKLRNQT